MRSWRSSVTCSSCPPSNACSSIPPALPPMLDQVASSERGASPLVTTMRVIPVAGRDSMLLNLSGAHGPFFTRNIVVLEDNAGHTGVSEVPGGEAIRRTLEEAKPLVLG